jgi:hypothetical protein
MAGDGRGASVIGRLLRALGGLAILASAALPNLRNEAREPVSPLAYVASSPRLLLVALVTFGLPYAFGAFAVASAGWPIARTPRAMSMGAVAFGLLAALGAGLGGLALLVTARGHRSVGLLLVGIAAVGVAAIRRCIKTGELPTSTRASLATGAAVVAAWFVVLYVDEQLAGSLLGIAGGLLALAGTSLDAAPAAEGAPTG